MRCWNIFGFLIKYIQENQHENKLITPLLFKATRNTTNYSIINNVIRAYFKHYFDIIFFEILLQILTFPSPY